jgi:hypothetical protein
MRQRKEEEALKEQKDKAAETAARKEAIARQKAKD